MLIFDGGSLVLAIAQWKLVVNEFEVRWMIFSGIALKFRPYAVMSIISQTLSDQLCRVRV